MRKYLASAGLALALVAGTGIAASNTADARYYRGGRTAGIVAGTIIGLNEVLDSYYESMGWEKETGLPSQAKIEELGLQWAAATS